jgi:hypothetical protein
MLAVSVSSFGVSTKSNEINNKKTTNETHKEGM